jgi:hypothetical protein
MTIGITITIATRLGKSTNWSVPIFQRCSSHHIKQVILALMWPEVIVTQQCVPTIIYLLIVAQQLPSVMQVAYPIRKTSQTDRYRWVHRVFFTHIRD